MNENGDHYTLHDSFGYWVVQMGRHILSDINQKLEDHGLNDRLLAVILAVDRANKDTPSAVAEYLDIDRAVVARSLRELEERQILVSIPNSDDGRSRKILLTDTGKHLAFNCSQVSIHVNQQLRGGMSDELAKAIKAHFERIVMARRNNRNRKALGTDNF